MIDKINQIRRDRNRDILKRMKSGDELQAYEAEASFFPPRPKVQKDWNQIRKLYGDKNKKDKNNK